MIKIAHRSGKSFCRFIVGLAIPVIFAGALISPACAQDRLAIVSPHWEGIRYEFENAFNQRYQKATGRSVDIEWLDVGGTSEILQYLYSEFRRSPNGIGIDMLFGGGTDPFVQLKKAKLLEPHSLPPSIQDGLAPSAAGIALHDPDGFFYSPVMAAFGFMCNQEVIARLNLPAPKTWEDFTTKSYHSWVGSADPRRSGSVHMAYEVILQAYGWEKGWNLIYRMAANTRTVVASSTQLGHDIADGEVACGFAIDSHATAQMRKYGTDKISFTVPNETPVVNGDAIAILKGSRNLETAKAFVEFLLSEEAQRIWYLKVGAHGGPEKYQLSRLPVRPAVYAPDASTEVTINPFSWGTRFSYNAELGAKRWRLVNDLFGTTVIDQLPALKSQPNHNQTAPIPESEMLRLVSLPPADYARNRFGLMQSWRGDISWSWILLILPLLFIQKIISRLVTLYSHRTHQSKHPTL